MTGYRTGSPPSSGPTDGPRSGLKAERLSRPGRPFQHRVRHLDFEHLTDNTGPVHQKQPPAIVNPELAFPRLYARLAQRLPIAPNGRVATITLQSGTGSYKRSGRLIPNDRYPDRYAVTEAFLPIIRRELEALVEAGCEEIAVDKLLRAQRGHAPLRRHLQSYCRVGGRSLSPVNLSVLRELPWPAGWKVHLPSAVPGFSRVQCG